MELKKERWLNEKSLKANPHLRRELLVKGPGEMRKSWEMKLRHHYVKLGERDGKAIIIILTATNSFHFFKCPLTH